MLLYVCIQHWTWLGVAACSIICGQVWTTQPLWQGSLLNSVKLTVLSQLHLSSLR